MRAVVLLLFYMVWISVNGQDLESTMKEAGLINVQSVNPDLLVDLRYSDTSNFMGIDIYGGLSKCYLQKEVANSLDKAQQALRMKYPYYRLLLLDCARPLSVQKVMWDTVKKEVSEKVKFLSNPEHGSLHNYGAAVDVTLSDDRGNELDMGTPFDYMGELAYPEMEEQLLREGRLTYRAVENRKILREAMRAGGFFNIQTEWWHFNAMNRSTAAEKYQIIE